MWDKNKSSTFYVFSWHFQFSLNLFVSNILVLAHRCCAHCDGISCSIIILFFLVFLDKNESVMIAEVVETVNLEKIGNIQTSNHSCQMLICVKTNNAHFLRPDVSQELDLVDGVTILAAFLLCLHLWIAEKKNFAALNCILEHIEKGLQNIVFV